MRLSRGFVPHHRPEHQSQSTSAAKLVIPRRGTRSDGAVEGGDDAGYEIESGVDIVGVEGEGYFVFG